MTDHKTIEYFDQVNYLLRHLLNSCESLVEKDPYRLGKGCPYISGIQTNAINADDLAILNSNFSLVGSYGPIFKGLRVTPLVMNPKTKSNCCKETDTIAHCIGVMIGQLTGEWCDGPLHHTAYTNLRLSDKREYILDCLREFAAAAPNYDGNYPSTAAR